MPNTILEESSCYSKIKENHRIVNMVQTYLHHIKLFPENVKIFLLGNFAQAFGLSIYSLLFNLFLKEMGYGESMIGHLISTTTLGITLMSFPAAMIMEKFHVKHLVMVGTLVSSFFYVMQIFSNTPEAIFGFGLVASMFLALFNISVSPFYLRNSTPQMRMHLFSLNSGSVMFAHMLGYLVGGSLPKLVHHFYPTLTMISNYRISIAAALSIVLVSNLIFSRIKRVPIPRLKQSMLSHLKDKDWKMIFKLVTPKLFFALGGGLIIPFINLYLKEKFQLSTQMIGFAYAALQLFIFLGIFVTPALVKRMPPLMFIIFTALGSVPFMVAMAISGSIGMVLGAFFMRGMLMNMSTPVTSMFEMEHVKEQECVFASALILFFYNLVYTSTTRMGGWMIEKYSFGPTFYVAAVCYLAAIIFYYKFFGHELKKKEEPRIETQDEEILVLSKVA